MQTTYKVLWVIDIEATSPVDAARQALKIQRNPESIATSFIIEDENKNSQVIDLEVSDLHESWGVKDWAGNKLFQDKTFTSFDDAESFLCEHLGDNYDTDRGEYFIIPLF